MLTGQTAHIDTSRVVVRRAGSPAASRVMTGSLQSQSDISVQAADAGRLRLVTRFHATNAVVEIAANDSRQPPHETDIVRQALHVESLPTANFCGNFCGADLALQAVVEITANEHRQPPHASHVVLQALHVEPMPAANFCGVGLTLQVAPSAKEFLARNASAVTLPTEAITPRPDVVGDSYWPAD